ncbi:MAG: sigma-70 family RNA polymerase sigma factor [Oscillospiraceae bacterium]|nr:sigma-70 family RNA polymerase sigma factor [Oscillospiraceae bacterium]
MREELILRKIKRGDTAALQALMDCYIPYISAVVWNILRNAMTPQDAEEVVSDVFLAAWDQAEDLKEGHVKAWLGSVARHKAMNKLRRMGVDLPLEEDVLELGGDSPEEQLERAEEARLVRRAVDTLPEPDREVFLRHYYHAQTVREISSYMNLNESTIKTKLRRGRMRLKELLTGWGI